MHNENLITDLHEERLDTVVRHLLATGAKSVLDLGCGSGALLQQLLKEDQFERITGIDTSTEALASARDLIEMDRAASSAQVDLLYASFTQSNENLMGFDAAALVETIEHVAPNNLSAVEFAVFACYRPKVVIVTTPNQEYNINYGIGPGKFRHLGHQFEWSRRKFQRWSNGVACRNGSVSYTHLTLPTTPYV